MSTSFAPYSGQMPDKSKHICLLRKMLHRPWSCRRSRIWQRRNCNGCSDTTKSAVGYTACCRCASACLSVQQTTWTGSAAFSRAPKASSWVGPRLPMRRLHLKELCATHCRRWCMWSLKPRHRGRYQVCQIATYTLSDLADACGTWTGNARAPSSACRARNFHSRPNLPSQRMLRKGKLSKKACWPIFVSAQWATHSRFTSQSPASKAVRSCWSSALSTPRQSKRESVWAGTFFCDTSAATPSTGRRCSQNIAKNACVQLAQNENKAQRSHLANGSAATRTGCVANAQNIMQMLEPRGNATCASCGMSRPIFQKSIANGNVVFSVFVWHAKSRSHVSNAGFPRQRKTMALLPGKLAMLTDAVAASASRSCGGIGLAPNVQTQSENHTQSLRLGAKATITVKMARSVATRASV